MYTREELENLYENDINKLCQIYIDAGFPEDKIEQYFNSTPKDLLVDQIMERLVHINNESSFMEDKVSDNAAQFIDDPVSDNAAMFIDEPTVDINSKIGSYISRLSESIKSSLSEGADIDLNKVILYAQQIELMAEAVKSNDIETINNLSNQEINVQTDYCIDNRKQFK